MCNKIKLYNYFLKKEYYKSKRYNKIPQSINCDILYIFKKKDNTMSEMNIKERK
jgi:hypothetical protein